ncbi:MAG: hypothetical protein ACR2HS_01830 [Gammaproteobacteria bacterium]
MTIKISRVGNPDPSDIFGINISNIANNTQLWQGANWYVPQYNSNGVLTYGQILFGSNQSGIIFTNQNGVATIVCNGSAWNNSLSKINLNYVLQNLTYQSTSVTPVSKVDLQYTFDDGYGNLNFITGVTSININAVETPMIITSPQSVSVKENSNFLFSGKILFNDSDPESTLETVILKVNNGTMNLDLNDNVTISGNGTNSLVISGTIGQINNCIAKLNYIPKFNYTGADTLTIIVNDEDPTNTSGINTTTTIGITVNANIIVYNQAPSIMNLAATSVNEYTRVNFSPIIVNNNTIISDPNLNALNHGSGNYSNSNFMIMRNNGGNYQDLFGFAYMPDVSVKGNTLIVDGNVIANFTNQYGVLQIHFVNTGTIPTFSLVNEVVQAIQYSNNGIPSGNITLSYIFDNGTQGTNSSVSANININVIADNVAPINTVPVTQNLLQNTLNQNSSSIVFNSSNNNAITIDDPNNSNDTAETITLIAKNGILSFSEVVNLTKVVNHGALITATGKIADLNNALSGLTYTSNANYLGTDHIQLITNNNNPSGEFSGNLITTSNININIAQITNQAPIVNMPNITNYLANSERVTFNGNINIADPDGSNSVETVILSVNNGKLNLGTTDGLTLLNGNNSNTVTIAGNISKINYALNGLIYTPNAGYVGGDLITLKVNDNNSANVNGALSVVGSMAFNIGSSLNMPSLIVPSSINYNTS